MELAKASVTNSGEQWTRNAVSRAYYSMYHSALRVVGGVVPTHDKQGEKIPGGTHARFYNYLCSGEAAAEHNVDPTLTKKIGLKLKTQHFHRVTADYKLSQKINRVVAVISIQDAEEIDNLVSTLIIPD
jgi:uncharacterized protein (UPF0332 family)